MNPHETVRAAIARLEGLKESVSPGPRFIGDANGSSSEYGPLWVVSNEETSTDRRDEEAPEDWFMELACGREEDAQLIVMLHRTIDVQLSILRGGLTYSQMDPNLDESDILALAKAILA